MFLQHPCGENVERMVMDMASIANALDQFGVLSEDAVTNIVQGLSLASHLKFVKIVVDHASDLENPLMKDVELEGNTAYKKILRYR